MSTTARRRGAETPALAAGYLREHGFPWCTDAGSGRQGTDLLNTPGLLWEVKAWQVPSVLAWLRQADHHGTTGLCQVLWRPRGMGPASIEDWPVMTRFGPYVDLLRAAGYGDPLTPSLTGSEGRSMR